MTKKDYKAFAEVFKIARQRNQSLNAIIAEVASVFYLDNNKFDRTKFYEACGLIVTDEYEGS